jgi:hypothetical protein
MDEQFELPVEYKGELLLLKASLQVVGYTHKFIVDVSGREVIFEPDEERNYRAIPGYGDICGSKHVDIELLKAIANIIEQLVK